MIFMVNLLYLGIYSLLELYTMNREKCYFLYTNLSLGRNLGETAMPEVPPA